MTLARDSLLWAVDHLARYGDSDLFPKPLELQGLRDRVDDFVSLVEGKPLSQFGPGAYRRFIVPKDELSYRQATQIDPQDSVLLTATIHQFGAGIEQRRLAPDQVFSYRFAPTPDRGLYNGGTAWNDFWTKAHDLSKRHQVVVHCDIADFYNQIYHHELENQLIASGFPNQATRWIINLVSATTAGVSRGLPVAPHPVHLLAEATLIPVDESLVSSGMRFVRFADDYIVFCASKRDALACLSEMAKVLDRSQRLLLQRHKTRIYDRDSFQTLCAAMIEDHPINSDEEDLLALVRKYSGGNPYRTVFFGDIGPEEWSAISPTVLRRIIEQYISASPTDYVRLRWLYRRLAQIGHPGAIEVSLDYLENLTPCFAGICAYLASVQSIAASDWASIGERLLRLLESPEVANSEYFAVLLLSLFSRNEHIDHFPTLARMYEGASPCVRREILLSAKANSAHGWLRQHKESFMGMDPWQRLAFIYGCSGLPSDEKKYFINRWDAPRPFEKVLAKWSKSI